jgi:hypothetical protein
VALMGRLSTLQLDSALVELAGNNTALAYITSAGTFAML